MGYHFEDKLQELTDMSSRFAVLGKISPVSPTDSPACEYTALIQRFFQDSSVVAIIGAGFGNSVTSICEGIASELSRLGRRVVLVSVNGLLQVNTKTLSDETVSIPRGGRDYWLWPSPGGQHLEFLKSRTPTVATSWLDSLSQNFDSVLLDCTALETTPGGAAIAAMAETAILAVDAERTPKQQILLDQRLLQLSGVKLAGCILIHAK